MKELNKKILAIDLILIVGSLLIIASLVGYSRPLVIAPIDDLQTTNNSILFSFEKADVILFCSPNNPTGAVANRKQLTQLVEFARKNKSIIIFDAAYSEYISRDLPKSIFEIEGAKEVAIEVNSLSKPVGFTGVRLGWTVIPNELKFDDGTSVKDDWNRVMTTLFNGASNVAQRGALAALDDDGIKEMKQTTSYYMENAKIIKEGLESLDFEVYGGAKHLQPIN